MLLQCTSTLYTHAHCCGGKPGKPGLGAPCCGGGMPGLQPGGGPPGKPGGGIPGRICVAATLLLTMIAEAFAIASLPQKSPSQMQQESLLCDCYLCPLPLETYNSFELGVVCVCCSYAVQVNSMQPSMLPVIAGMVIKNQAQTLPPQRHCTRQTTQSRLLVQLRTVQPGLRSVPMISGIRVEVKRFESYHKHATVFGQTAPS